MDRQRVKERARERERRRETGGAEKREGGREKENRRKEDREKEERRKTGRKERESESESEREREREKVPLHIIDYSSIKANLLAIVNCPISPPPLAVRDRRPRLGSWNYRLQDPRPGAAAEPPDTFK